MWITQKIKWNYRFERQYSGKQLKCVGSQVIINTFPKIFVERRKGKTWKRKIERIRKVKKTCWRWQRTTCTTKNDGWHIIRKESLSIINHRIKIEMDVETHLINVRIRKDQTEIIWNKETKSWIREIKDCQKVIGIVEKA